MTNLKPGAALAAPVGLASLEQRATALLDQLSKKDRLRSLRPMLPDASRLDLTHNDYLGLRSDAHFQAMALRSVQNLSVGAGASRLLGGEHPIFRELELSFAHFKGAPEALFFGSGFAANEAVAVALAQLGGRIFSDSLNHASIIDGIRLSGLAHSERVIFPHGDLVFLERQLALSPAPYNLIFSESLFSMDGDHADLHKLADLAQRYNGVLVIDEAHAIGCCGPQGRGLVAAAGLEQERLITINTCGKALGVSGALVCGPQWFRDLLINVARPFIYSTAPSPWIAAALLTSVNYMAELEERRFWLADAAQRMIGQLTEMGYHTGTSQSHIIPIICGDDSQALALAKTLTDEGVEVRAIRPPTVPEGTSRVRISLHAALGESGFYRIIKGFQKAAKDHAP